MRHMRSFVPKIAALAGAAACAAALVVPGAGYSQTTSAPVSDSSPAAAGYHQRKTLEERLSELHAALQISSSQESLWQSFVAAKTSQAAARKQWLMDNPPSATLTLPQRIDRRTARMQQLLPARQASDAALKQLYSALTPAQQTTMEIAMAHMKHRHGGGRSMG